MNDRFVGMSESLMGPSCKAMAVTPSASALPYVAKRIYVGGAGDVVLQLVGDTAPVVYTAVPAGTHLHVRAAYVFAGGGGGTTTATNIVAEF